MSKVYDPELVEELLDKIESLAKHKRTRERELKVVDDLLVGTKYNWQGTGKGRQEVLKELLKDAGVTLLPNTVPLP